MKFYNKSMEGIAMQQQQQQMPPMQPQQQLMNAPQQQLATQANLSEKDTQLVNDILDGLNEQNQEAQNNNNNAMYQHQTDTDANVMRQGLPPPTQEQIQEMNEINQQNQMQNNHMNMQNIEEELMGDSTSKIIDNDNDEQQLSVSVFDNIKDSIVVLFLVFVFMMLPINKLMVKIPTAIDTFGNATMIGNLLKALVAGILYFVYVRYLK